MIDQSNQSATYNITCLRIPSYLRTIAAPVLVRPEAAYTDIANSDLADSEVGPTEHVIASYRARLTPAQVEEVQRASNLIDIEVDGTYRAALVEVLPLDEPPADETRIAGQLAPAAHGVPTERTTSYIDAAGLEAEGWDGTGRVCAVLDGGTSAALKALFGWRIVDAYDFVADTEVTGARNAHGCYVTCEAIPAGAALAEYVVFAADGTASWSNLARAIRRAAERGSDVLNFSGAGPGDSRVVRDAIAYARQLRPGMVIYASAGNDGGVIGYPAAYPEVYASIACDERTDRRADFSSHGIKGAMSPGVRCRSFDPDARPLEWSGTSSSSPKDARLCLMGATVRGAGHTFTPVEVAAALWVNARDTAEPTNEEGAGALRLRHTLTRLGAVGPPKPEPVRQPWWWLRW